MTLRECIDEIDEIEPNAYSDDHKTAWILRAEGSVATGIYLLPPSAVATLADTGNYSLLDYPLLDYPLLAPPPFDKLYPLYLHAMIHYANSEYERYQNDMQLYNAAYGEFARWFAGKYQPALTIRRLGASGSGTAPYDLYCYSDGFPVKEGDVLTDVRLSSEANVYNFLVALPDAGGGPYYFFCTSGDYPDEDGMERSNFPFFVPFDGTLCAECSTSLSDGAEFSFRCNVVRYGWPDKYGRRP